MDEVRVGYIKDGECSPCDVFFYVDDGMPAMFRPQDAKDMSWTWPKSLRWYMSRRGVRATVNGPAELLLDVKVAL